MTLLCTQTRVTTPGTTLSETAAATTATPPEAIRDEETLFRPLQHRTSCRRDQERKGERKRKKEKEDIVSLDGWILFPARSWKKKKNTDLTKYTRKPIVIPRESELTERQFVRSFVRT